MSKIKILDGLTIQKIAAGEVIERPASIVKELVENSIDAGSNQIIIETTDGGKSLIRVTDNGEGMDTDDVLVAFERHSTSKLFSIDDLNSIMTLGFRGEALSSISAVSKVEVITRRIDSNEGIKATVSEGKVTDISSIGSPIGTTMIIRNLFYNLPVRKKFLKSNSTEDSHISDILTKLAIGNPQVSIKYLRDNRVIFNTNGNKNNINTIYELLGKDNAKDLISIDIETVDFSVNGYLSNNTLYRSNRQHQYLYVNGRYVIDHKISKVIENQYSSLIPINKYPVFILNIKIDPKNIDVNIHPTKQEIKFVGDTLIYEKLGLSIKRNLNSIINISKNINKKVEEVQSTSIFDVKNKEKDDIEIDNTFDIESAIVFKDYSSLDINHALSESLEVREDITETRSVKKIDLGSLDPIGIAFKTYIFLRDTLNNKLYVIDQHAAHERVLYERLSIEYEKESILIQQLLYPEIIELNPKDYMKAMENIEYFNLIGFEAEMFDEKSVIIRGVPMLFGKPNSRELFIELLDKIEDKLDSTHHAKIDKIIKLACTSAIKAGDSIKTIEIKSLLSQMDKCDNPYTCPHGRPTIIEITKDELEKKFLRII